ncbi:MAG: pyruvate flavodoxin/ferredoxin oxidoreductase-like [Gammaproteobacteria bacterium]|nr:pyruvate flavodoxin/ferredoxin oxidoreductase-like [Gammaproteobacteria bacterium]
MQKTSMSIAVVGSGGAGSITAGNLLLEAAARSGSYGILTRSVGPQIRGGEAAALIRLSSEPIDSICDSYDILLALDWKNADRFAAELPMGPHSLIITDPEQGAIPAVIGGSGAQVRELPIGKLAKSINKGRPNMIALGVLAEVLSIPRESIKAVLTKQLGDKGEQVLQSSMDTVTAGMTAAQDIAKQPLPKSNGSGSGHWLITGNQATGLGAVRAGVRFVAAYPITPATEVLEWLATALQKVGGKLVQAEDELASVNMIIGASYGGIPSLTATSGPGLSLMMEGLGLAVSAEVPIVVVDVMRVGPSTGIATKAEQSDLNIALYGLHGDAPHLVLAPVSITDCLFTAQWSVYLAEAMQVPAILLSDQYLGQAMAIIEPPEAVNFKAARSIAQHSDGEYLRYADTGNGISPMAIPGTPGQQYTADGLEHSMAGTPSTRAEDHALQMDKRQRKLDKFDYGDYWAEIEGAGAHAIITWGSTTGAVREALGRLRAEGIDDIRMVAMRLLSPAQPGKFRQTMAGVSKVLVIEQSHSGQFYKYLRAHYDLPGESELFHRAGPLLLRPGETADQIRHWRQA